MYIYTHISLAYHSSLMNAYVEIKVLFVFTFSDFRLNIR